KSGVPWANAVRLHTRTAQMIEARSLCMVVSSQLLIGIIAEDRSIFLIHSRDDSDPGSILRATHVDRDLLSRLQHISIPAGTAEDSGCPAFQSPLHFFALLVDREIQPCVRIGPLPLLDYSRYRCHLIHLIG